MINTRKNSAVLVVMAIAAMVVISLVLSQGIVEFIDYDPPPQEGPAGQDPNSTELAAEEPNKVPVSAGDD